MDHAAKVKTVVKISSFRDGRFRDEELFVISELPLTLMLGDREIVTLLYNGQDPKVLAAGFFYSEGFLDEARDVAKVEFDPVRQLCRIDPVGSKEFYEELFGKRMITSGCGKGSSFYHAMDSIASGKVRLDDSYRIEGTVIQDLAKKVFQSSELYKDTHGVHSAALCDKSGIVLFFEDIGRHNALDKIAGQCLLDGIETQDKILFTTGRITSEVMIKAGRLGCPVVASRSSATALALDLAEKTGVTVIGGAKKGGFHVYLGRQRIIESENTTSEKS